MYIVFCFQRYDNQILARSYYLLYAIRAQYYNSQIREFWNLIVNKEFDKLSEKNHVTSNY